MVTCTNCKEIFHENATHCPACGTEASKINTMAITKSTKSISYRTVDMGFEFNGKQNLFVYASNGRRLFAWLIDFITVTVFTGILSGIFGEFGSLPALILAACYYGYFESSKYMGTPGKIVMHLRVIKPTGESISFINGVGRYAARAISAIIIGIGYPMPTS